MRSTRSIRGAFFLAFLLPAGCISLAKKRDDLPPPVPEPPVIAAELYTLACPDLVDVVFLDWPDVSQTVKIGADGCINLGSLGKIRIEGQTVAEAAATIAARAEIPTRKVGVQVIEFNSRQVLLYGEINGAPRAVDYRGPETVVELLHRAGGLAADAAPNAIHLVRARAGEVMATEILRVDLKAIQERHDERTNIRVQPLDAIYVDELPRYRFRKTVPTFLQPAYDVLLELLPTEKPTNLQQRILPSQ